MPIILTDVCLHDKVTIATTPQDTRREMVFRIVLLFTGGKDEIGTSEGTMGTVPLASLVFAL